MKTPPSFATARAAIAENSGMFGRREDQAAIAAFQAQPLERRSQAARRRIRVPQYVNERLRVCCVFPVDRHRIAVPGQHLAVRQRIAQVELLGDRAPRVPG